MAAGLHNKVLVSMDLLIDREVCVACDTSSPLVCPPCPSTQSCTFVYPANCQTCAQAICVDNESPSTPAPTNTPSAKPSSGALAGGVIGGVAFIAIATYLVWRCCVKNRRQAMAGESWTEGQPSPPSGRREKDFAEQRSNRASTHTANSIASTVLTRASNIIQIAYIPGVTNRANLTSPGMLAPPMPPVPVVASRPSSPAATEEQHFFVPGDLRDSTYSGMSGNSGLSGLSGFTDRTSFGRTSYAPRSSVASTIYGKNAVIVSAGQTGMRAKPAVVSVKTASSTVNSRANSTGTVTPPVPAVDYEKYHERPTSPAPSTFSVGSTFLNNASAATPARATMVRVGSVKKTKASTTGSSSIHASELSSSPPPGSSPLVASSSSCDSRAVTLIEDSPIDKGPFADPPSLASRRSNNNLSAVIEEATRRASERLSSMPSVARNERGTSPFGDEHVTEE